MTLTIDALPENLRDWMYLHQFDKGMNNVSAFKNALPEDIKNTEDSNNRIVKNYLPAVYQVFNDLRASVKRKRKYHGPQRDTGPIETSQLNYPFSSKIDDYMTINDNWVEIPDYAPDMSISALAKKFKKPNYSPHRNSWEMDIMFTHRKKYLVFININTRYAIVIPIKSKSAQDISDAIKEARAQGVAIEHIKGDGEAGFDTDAVRELFGNAKNVRLDKSPFTFHNKQVDSFIRTLRNAAGLSEDVLDNNDIVQQLVAYYNDTPHNGLLINKALGIHYTPREMMNDPDLEWDYIRAMDRKLKDVQKMLSINGFDKYKPGNILIMHLDKGKTNMSFTKVRRNFDELGEFVRYDTGSVMVKWLTSNVKNKNPIIRVPIFYTKKIADSYDTIPNNYRKLFNLKT